MQFFILKIIFFTTFSINFELIWISPHVFNQLIVI